MKILYTLLLILITSLLNWVYAEWENWITDTKNSLQKEQFIKQWDFHTNTKLWETTTIDLSSIEKKLWEKLDSKVEFEWNVKWSTTQVWKIFKKQFEKYGQKIINLNIYKVSWDDKELITSEDISLFIFKNKSLIIFDKQMWNDEIKRYIEKSSDEGILVEKITEISTKEIEKQHFIESIEQTGSYNFSENNYITIWWSKEFLSWVLSKITKEKKINPNDKKFNIVLVSAFNTDVLQSYLKNFLSNKHWISSILLLPESSTSQIRYNPWNIKKLEQGLNSKQYEYVNINTQSKISKIYFVSQFINTLSNQWFSSNGIWLILLIPFLFTGISIMKHLIGLSPIWAIIPIGITLLFFQIWLLPAGIILSTLILTNLLLSKITNRYTLLYTPKISFIIIINISIMMILINILFNYNILKTGLSDIIFIILFILISERLITIILSKEFNEYRFALINTILFGLIAYLIFNISFIQTIIFAYPELILILIPINFLIWTFTWLRITEYFRFREVIQNIEE